MLPYVECASYARRAPNLDAPALAKTAAIIRPAAWTCQQHDHHNLQLRLLQTAIHLCNVLLLTNSRLWHWYVQSSIVERWLLLSEALTITAHIL